MAPIANEILIVVIIFFLCSKDYHPIIAYNQSKLAQVLFTRHLQLLINQDEDWHVQVHAVHPGIVDTDLFVHSSTTYVPWFKKLFFKVNARCVVLETCNLTFSF